MNLQNRSIVGQGTCLAEPDAETLQSFVGASRLAKLDATTITVRAHAQGIDELTLAAMTNQWGRVWARIAPGDDEDF